jgi:hypothetical protein
MLVEAGVSGGGPECQKSPCGFVLRQDRARNALSCRNFYNPAVPLLPELLPKCRLGQSAESFSSLLIRTLEPLRILAKHYSRIMPTTPRHDVNAHAFVQEQRFMGAA